MSEDNGNNGSGTLGFDEEMCVSYLLGELSENDQERFEAAYFADDVFFDRYMAVKNELLDLYSRGELDAADRIAKTPIWVLVGDQDSAGTVQNCRDMAAALEKGGGEVKFTVYPDVGHDCWTLTYDNPGAYEWLLSHRSALK